MEILGARVDNASREEILTKIESFLIEEKFHQIATVNPEFILTAQKDSEFKNVLNSCDLNVADGFGLKLAFWKDGESLKSRIPGADLMLEILRLASEKDLKVFLAASVEGLSNWEETRDAILKKYPSLEIDGINLDKNTKYQILDTEYHILFCNFGAPQQEKFLHSLKSEEFSKIRLAMGVGGSFDYLTGKIKRAPVWMRKIGLEWLWRLALEPRYRAKRVWNAVVVFPLKVYFESHN